LPIQAVVFDIGGVLEFNPRTGWALKWEAGLNLPPGTLAERLGQVWQAGSIGTMPEEEVEKNIRELLGLDQAQLAAFMADIWKEYVGILNVELTDYFASLRPRYRTGIISNSFVGARQREEALYHFGELCDLVVYSHEEGVSKPAPRIFELACQRLEVPPGEMIFLDDVPGHVAAARAQGIRAILYEDNAQAIADIQRCLEAAY
jgi:epoxide hydrolase-like predicted phosphatase